MSQVSNTSPRTVGELRTSIAGLPDDMLLRSDDSLQQCFVSMGVRDGMLSIEPGEETEKDWDEFEPFVPEGELVVQSAETQLREAE